MKPLSRNVLRFYRHKHLFGDFYLIRNYSDKAKKISIWSIRRIERK